MLTKADDFPIHQRAEPIAFAGTDRNFYDRYFFNGYSADGRLFFAAAMGIYPHLNVTDAAFSLVHGGKQRSVLASRLLGFERMDTQVAPISVTVEEPLQRLRLTLAPNDSGIEAELVFDGRAFPIEEPRFTRRIGTRTLMDVTRMTQNGRYTGWISLDGQRHDVAGMLGTRDRSWGVRPIGAADPQPPVPMAMPQFYWLWAPLNFPTHQLYFHTNDDGDGQPWNRSMLLIGPDGTPRKLWDVRSKLSFKPGTRHASAATIEGTGTDGPVKVELTVHDTFFMQGIGYGHPTRAHGTFHGEHSVVTETIDTATADEGTIPLNHIQALVTAKLTLPGGQEDGRGVLEQLIIGPHAPSGFTGIFDLA
ncbi:hypothetical protein ACFOMD_01940 [Sphingoaurantiacus capsulatus]|uniref:Carotenoid 1,2-hydratase n=1 Tax=Sphingoaurantiacus capsulatus TaxID=1771310 RepID=A0ABV7X5P6_9SPHN